jgi:hypothetical protein
MARSPSAEPVLSVVEGLKKNAAMLLSRTACSYEIAPRGLQCYLFLFSDSIRTVAAAGYGPAMSVFVHAERLVEVCFRAGPVALDGAR